MALVRFAAQQSSSYRNTTRPSSYDVFLSFRGEDTRKTFSDHLFTAFMDQGFRIFRDDDDLERGEDINPGLQKAIQESQSSVIVFSKNYASSCWCLDELLVILQRRRTSRNHHIVLPVFYDVDPSQVRKQTGSFENPFARHEQTQPSNKVSQWRAALAEVADLAGMVLQNQADGYESKFVKTIVKEMGDKLNRTPVSVGPDPIGIFSPAKGTIQADSIDGIPDDHEHHNNDDNAGMELEGGDDDVVKQEANQTASIATSKSCAKRRFSNSSNMLAGRLPKRREKLEKRVAASEANCGGNEVIRSVAKDVADEELMQCFEILNFMEEIDDESYSKALKLFRDDATLRKMFPRISCLLRGEQHSFLIFSFSLYIFFSFPI